MTPEKPPELKHVIDSNQELLAVEHSQSELLISHHRLGHLPFSKIKILSLLGITPERLANTKPPKCKGCIYRAITKRLWCIKGRQTNSIQTVTASGKRVLVEQLESPIPGFLAQLKGRLTKEQYIATTFFVENFRCLVYVHLQRNLT